MSLEWFEAGKGPASADPDDKLSMLTFDCHFNLQSKYISTALGQGQSFKLLRPRLDRIMTDEYVSAWINTL